MQRVMLFDIDPAALEVAFGATRYAQGVQFARQRAVVRTWWTAAEGVLHGVVRDRSGDLYPVTIHFASAGSPALRFEYGECECFIGFNCAHVAAVMMAATDALVEPGSTGRGPRPVAWEQSLESLLGSRPASSANLPGDTPLAIELSLSGESHRAQARGAGQSGQPPRLAARLVQPGKNGGWVGGSLSWSKLTTLGYYTGYSAAQVRLLREIYAIYQAGSGRSGYYSYGYSYGDEKSIDLSAFESRQLWPLLDEAESIGLRLVHVRKLGPVVKYCPAELCLDITRSEQSGGLAITPVLNVGGTHPDIVPLRFIGSQGHGLVYVDRAQAEASADPSTWRFRLARLTRDVPGQLHQMALAGQRLELPAEGEARFRDEYYPRLRHAATVISSDDSFTPPAISGPTLVLHAAYGSGHELGVSWEWAYQVGDLPRRAPLQPAPAEAGYRDLDAERAVVAGLDVSLDRFGLLRPDPSSAAAGQALAPGAQLGGIDTMRFSTELLPLLAGQPGVAVEVTGEPADYREAGDTLRIGVSAEEVAGDTDWFDLGVTITVEGREVPFTDVFMALSRGESHLLLPDGAYFSLEKPELRQLARLIEEARALQDSPGGTLKISRFQAGLWGELAELGVVTHQARAWQRQVDGLLSAGAIDSRQPPAALAGRLRPYQLDGFQWLAFLWEHQLGGILADDMGLGKTLQALALIWHAKQADPATAPFLIVAPTSVVANWAAEAGRFTPGLNVVSITDTVSRRGQALDEITAGADVVVTSYTLLRLDFDAYSKVTWSGLMLDEAQYTKNHQSKIYQCARRLPAPFKLALTGTPMENNLMELWALLSITAPGLFPSPTRFREYYARPIEKQGSAELLDQFRRRIRPLVKRRTKEQVAADLPAKQEQVLEIDLHPRHRKLYQTYLQRERQKVLGLINDMNANRFTILRSLTLLRQLSLHAGLIDEAHRDLPSSKIDALLEHLRDVADGGHRALVFSQFTRFLGMIRARLDEAGLQYCYLDGSTRNRAAVIQAFKEGQAPVFLISLKAGGFGLNLAEADYCFLLDPWWNPATEAQAVDRTHRIGQTRNVMVYRLIAAGTIEEKVMALKARKAELFSSVIDSGNVFGASLDAEEIRGLFA